MKSPTKRQSDVLSAITDQVVKIVIALTLTWLFVKATFYILETNCDKEYSSLLLGFMELVFGGSIFVVVLHYFPSKNKNN